MTDQPDSQVRGYPGISETASRRARWREAGESLGVIDRPAREVADDSSRRSSSAQLHERTLIATLVGAILVLGSFFASPVVRGRVPVHGDLGFFNLPIRDFYARCLKPADAFDFAVWAFHAGATAGELASQGGSNRRHFAGVVHRCSPTLEHLPVVLGLCGWPSALELGCWAVGGRRLRRDDGADRIPTGHTDAAFPAANKGEAE